MEKYQQAAVCFAGSKYIDKDGNVLSCDMNKWKSAIPPYAVFNGKLMPNITFTGVVT